MQGTHCLRGCFGANMLGEKAPLLGEAEVQDCQHLLVESSPLGITAAKSPASDVC